MRAWPQAFSVHVARSLSPGTGMGCVSYIKRVEAEKSLHQPIQAG